MSKPPVNAEAVLFAFAKILDEYFPRPENSPTQGAGDLTMREAEVPVTSAVGSSFSYDATNPILAGNPSLTGPWDEIDVQRRTSINVQVEPDLHRKMLWLTENVPQMSLRKIAQRALTAEVDRMLAQYYQPE